MEENKHRRILGSRIRHSFVWEMIRDSIDGIDPIELMTKFPHGTETPQALYFSMYPAKGAEWNLKISDWYGDRSTIVICSHETSGYISIGDAIRFLFRDMLWWLLQRYPDDDYTLDLIDFVIEKNPELKEKEFYKNEENFEAQ